MPNVVAPAAGLYIVEPLNASPISVNANDPRMADRCLHVVRGYIKVGKTNSLASRERGYCKVFGPDNVRFRALALLEETRVAERCLLRALGQYRQRGPAGRRTEWLLGITAQEAAAVAYEHLSASALQHQWVWTHIEPTAEPFA